MFRKRNDFELVELLRKAPAHVRELAVALRLPPSTVLRALTRLREESIIDFTRKGRNTVYSLKETPEAQTFLLMVELYKRARLLEQPLFRSFVKELQRETNGELIVLFGSFAKGRGLQGSDIDIYVETHDAALKQRLSRLSPRFSIKTGAFSRKSILAKEIEKEHILLQNAERFYRLLA